MSRSGSDIRDSINQSKAIQARIALVEKHFGDLCSTFGSLSRKLGKLRDKGDEISNIVRTYAENESHNPSTKQSLAEFSGYFCAVQDYRDSEVQRINAKVIDPLSRYGAECKQAKEQCKAAFAAREKEMKQEKKLNTMKDNKPSDRHNISTAEMDLHQASVNAIDSNQRLIEKMVKIERKKLTDIKNILLDFVNIELFFHAKAIEMYTMCFESLKAIDEEEDLEEFRNSLKFGSSQQQRLQQMQRTGSRQSLNSTGQSRGSAGSGGTPMNRARSTPTPSRTSSSHPPASPRSPSRTTSAPATRQHQQQHTTPQTQQRQPQKQQQQQQQQRQQPQPQQRGQQQQHHEATTNGFNGNTTARSLGSSSMYTTGDEDDDDYDDEDDEEEEDEDEEYTEDDETPRPPPGKQQPQKPVSYNMFQAQSVAGGGPKRK